MTDSPYSVCIWNSMLVCDKCTIVDCFCIFLYLCSYMNVEEAQHYSKMTLFFWKNFKGFLRKKNSTQSCILFHEGSCFGVLICAYVPLCVHPAWRQWRRKAQTPMMHLFSLFCCVRAACGFVCLVPLGSLPQRQGLALFPFLYSGPLSLFHSLFNSHWVLLSMSFAPHSVAHCLYLPS